jgi:hypothetical protein
MRTMIHHDDRRRRRRIVIIVLLVIVFAEVLAFSLGIAAFTPLTAAAGAFVATAVYAAAQTVKVFFAPLDKLLAPDAGDV